MQLRRLGNTGLMVSPIAFGTMTFGGRSMWADVGNTDSRAARRQVDLCIDHGVNLFDTADMYSYGLSEEILGQAVKGKRDGLIIATKVGMPMSDRPNDAGLSRRHIIASCEQSLRRLGVEHIDLYQVHAWDGQTPLEETMGALDLLVRDGKVRYVGCSNFSAWHLMSALSISALKGYESFVCHQLHYSLQARDAELELVPAAIATGLGVLVWSPLAGGLLSGKFRRSAADPSISRHLTSWNEPPVYDRDKLLDVIDVAVEIGAAHNVSAAQVCLAWLLRKPGVTAVVVGARTDDQLLDNLAAADLILSEGQLDQLDQVSGSPLPYPYWHQQQTVYDRLSTADLSLLGRGSTSASTQRPAVGPFSRAAIAPHTPP